ncbi:hypothetical protein Nepgr_013186 [Nepenthes gracilis]|uniref:Uncharacterized protein n=1 Tax=Nepenthes gracilis TaxID=150966 RepID=A0AAD3SH06_NEPGR|nr:hypothetical protein Nepgr_013186 [Nepenthes gracilis]
MSSREAVVLAQPVETRDKATRALTKESQCSSMMLTSELNSALENCHHPTGNTMQRHLQAKTQPQDFEGFRGSSPLRARKENHAFRDGEVMDPQITEDANKPHSYGVQIQNCKCLTLRARNRHPSRATGRTESA